MSTKDHPDTVVTAPNVKERRFTRLLKCQLTDKELIESGDQLAQELSHLDSINSELESIKADYKAKTKAAESEIEALSNRVRNKFEMRPVDCHEIRNFETKKFCVLRVDTGDVIEERDLRQDELQMPLPETDTETENDEDTDTPKTTSDADGETESIVDGDESGDDAGEEE